MGHSDARRLCKGLAAIVDLVWRLWALFLRRLLPGVNPFDVHPTMQA